MTPGARVAAAIEILNEWRGDAPAERVLTRWGRNNRYAGSKDRAAIRDHVFGVLRKLDTTAWLGGGDTGRALMIGALVRDGVDVDTLFNGQGHAPDPLSDDEQAAVRAIGDVPDDVARNMPEWIFENLTRDHGDAVNQICAVMQDRAPVTLRVNVARTTVAEVQSVLEKQGVVSETVEGAPTALILPDAPRGIANWEVFQDGLIELQDASGQALISGLPLKGGMRVLDFCAGGGGKSLALAAHADVIVHASDKNVARMSDIASRAARAKAMIAVLGPNDIDQDRGYDLVLVDAPCSGSGTWRRTPEMKHRLTPEALQDYVNLQAEVLDKAAVHVAEGGALVYATCSIFSEENQNQVAAFIAQHSEFAVENERSWMPSTVGDGFFGCTLRRS